MKSINTWFSEYGESHQNPINKAIHWICVPLIFFSIIALLSAIPAQGLKSLFPNAIQPYVHWGSLILILALLFYLRLSFTMFIGVLIFSFICLQLIVWLEASGISVWLSSLSIFAAAWIGQFIGHKIEGQKPSFFKDVQFLLIGPAWLMGFIYKKLGIKY